MTLPAGIIIAWHGAIVDIPAGWALCDGTNGTPNLCNRFLIGAGDLYVSSATGGSETHNHTVTGTPHTHSLAAGGGLDAGANLSTTTEPENPTGTTNAASSLPPYYALAFIMKT